ncbi:hypothetical protein DFH29DRAFT_1071336 [Suillus ampliporus]|nr:hypothetical protein DFH29DRAFT_1071336 [Suillus ampliporus]
MPSMVSTFNFKLEEYCCVLTESNLKSQQVELTFKPKKRAHSNSPLFGEMSDSDIEFVGQRLSPNSETTLGLVEEPERKRHRDSFATLNIDDNSEVGTGAIVKVETELLKEFHSMMEENDVGKTGPAVAAGILSTYDFDGPYNFGNFDDNIQPSPAYPY